MVGNPLPPTCSTVHVVHRSNDLLQALTRLPSTRTLPLALDTSRVDGSSRLGEVEWSIMPLGTLDDAKIPPHPLLASSLIGREGEPEQERRHWSGGERAK